jgi:hypothetical protein
MCTHEPQRPATGDIARAAARVIASHPEQGWGLLCNGIVFSAAAGSAEKPGWAVNRSAGGRRKNAIRGPHVASRC